MSQNNHNQRNYEATFILDTRSYQEPVETLIEKIKTTIQGIQGVVNTTENHGQKPFARVTDRKFPAGIYVSFKVTAEPAFPSALKARFNLDKTVDRILVTVE